jgi:hypothetical protein
MKNKHTHTQSISLARATLLSGFILALSGCAHAPSINILGSFFPSWMLCGLIGIVLTVLVRLWFLRIKLEPELISPLVLVYPCLTAFFTFSLWLLFFS